MGEATVGEVMSRDVLSLDAATPLGQALEEMKRAGLRTMPVTERQVGLLPVVEDTRPVGVVTRSMIRSARFAHERRLVTWQEWFADQGGWAQALAAVGLSESDAASAASSADRSPGKSGF